MIFFVLLYPNATLKLIKNCINGVYAVPPYTSTMPGTPWAANLIAIFFTNIYWVRFEIPAKPLLLDRVQSK